MGFWYYVTGFYSLFVVGAVISPRFGSFSVVTGVKQRARGFLGFISPRLWFLLWYMLQAILARSRGYFGRGCRSCDFHPVGVYFGRFCCSCGGFFCGYMIIKGCLLDILIFGVLRG